MTPTSWNSRSDSRLFMLNQCVRLSASCTNIPYSSLNSSRCRIRLLASDVSRKGRWQNDISSSSSPSRSWIHLMYSSLRFRLSLSAEL